MSEPVEAGHASRAGSLSLRPLAHLPLGQGFSAPSPRAARGGFLPPSAASGRGGRTPWRWRNLTDSTDSTSARWSSSTSTVISPGDRSALGVIDESGRPFPSAVFLLQAHRRSLTARAPRPRSQSPRGPGNSRQPWLTAGLGPEAETGARPGQADPRGTRGRLLTVSSRGGSKSRLALLPFRTEGPTPPAKAPHTGTQGPHANARSPTRREAETSATLSIPAAASSQRPRQFISGRPGDLPQAGGARGDAVTKRGVGRAGRPERRVGLSR